MAADRFSTVDFRAIIAAHVRANPRCTSDEVTDYVLRLRGRPVTAGELACFRRHLRAEWFPGEADAEFRRSNGQSTP